MGWRLPWYVAGLLLRLLLLLLLAKPLELLQQLLRGLNLLLLLRYRSLNLL